MSEFDPPKRKRDVRRVANVRTVLGGIEHKRQVHARMNAVEATEGHSERWYEARENLYDFYARYGKPVLERTDLGQQEFDSRGERWDVV